MLTFAGVTLFDPGVMLGWFSFVLLIVVAVVVGRHQAKSKAADIWKSENEANKERATRLENEKREMSAQLTMVQGRLSKLEALPDLTAILGFLQDDRVMTEDRFTETMKEVGKLFEGHERRSEERHKQTLELFNESIAAQASLAVGIERLIQKK